MVRIYQRIVTMSDLVTAGIITSVVARFDFNGLTLFLSYDDDK